MPRERPSADATVRIRPDTMLPEQFALASTAQLQPERRLVAGILGRAVLDVLNYRGATSDERRRYFQEAVAWISGRDTGWLFSFENACSLLGLHPDSLRARLLAQGVDS